MELFPTQGANQSAKLAVGATRIPVLDQTDDDQVVLRDEILLGAAHRIVVGHLLGRSRTIAPKQRGTLAAAIKRSLAADDGVLTGSNRASKNFQGRGKCGHDPGNSGIGASVKNAV